MPRVLIQKELVIRIHKHGFSKELKGFVTALLEGRHPPRVYKASGIVPVYKPYADLDLHHHHLHRDGDPLLITQHIDDEIYGIALATHESYFRSDKLLWLKRNIEVIDWTGCETLRNQVEQHTSDDFDER